MKSCPYLKAGDFVVMYEKEEAEIDWDVKEDLKKRLYKVTQLSSKIVSKVYEFGDIFFAKNNISSSNAKYESAGYIHTKENKFLQNSHVQLKAIKVQIDRLGNISSVDTQKPYVLSDEENKNTVYAKRHVAVRQ